MRANYKAKLENKQLVIDGLEFRLAKINFSTVAKLEKMGLISDEWPERPIVFVTALMAISAGLTYDEAADSIQRHIDSGGNLDEFFAAAENAVNTADLRGWAEKKG